MSDRKKLFQKIIDRIPVILTGTIILILWELIVRIFSISKWLLPSPGSIMTAMWTMRNVLLTHSIRTLEEALLGLLLAVLMGILSGGLIYYFKFLKKTIYPLLVVSQTIPIIVLAPLLVIWLGYELLPKLVIVVLACFFPVAVNTVDGLLNVDQEKQNLVRAMGASEWQMFRLVNLPSALPVIFSGLKIAATYAVMAAVVAEWMGSDRGLGVFIVRSSNSYQTEQVFAGIILVSFFSIILFQLVGLMEKMMIPWQSDE